MTSKPIQVEERQTMTLEQFREMWPEWERPQPAYMLICECCRQQYAAGWAGDPDPIIVTFRCHSCRTANHLYGWIGDRHPEAQCPPRKGGVEYPAGLSAEERIAFAHCEWARLKAERENKP